MVHDCVPYAYLRYVNIVHCTIMYDCAFYEYRLRIYYFVINLSYDS